MQDLRSIGLEKGIHYETIITTKYNNKSNSAPIGVICTGNHSIMCRIFKTSHTLNNILKTNEFIVNVVDNPFAFTYSTLSTVPNSYLNSDNSLKCANSYFKCEVESIKDVVKTNDPINKSQKSIIKAKVVEIVKKNNKKPLNRAMDLLVESVHNMEKIDENPEYYLGRFKEAKRVITKVGSRKDKEAIKILLEELEKKGYGFN
ncbi:MAG: DUF447 family protein [Methanobrevibacter sp.]|uniref:DUF447 domain-containing protein n=1 Tax=Methanobrevibacter sp. TaxID=66852 RepID=UPI0026DF71B8|nr:DUF447 domain-containing protein [Methanobrevibacter sp.]MDO5848277.1 DUF447 family protein [Methanobrevibacter sp.]